MQDRNFDFRILSDNNLSTLYKHLTRFGLVTPVYEARMCTAGVNLTFHLVISEFTRPIKTKLSGLVVLREGFIKRSFILQSLKGRCHGNQFYGQICEIG